MEQLSGNQGSMKSLVVLSQKGVSGKTTLAGHIAVQAKRSGAGPVALLDADPQESLTDWWNARVADTLVCSQTSLWRLGADIRRVRERGTKLVVIDTPPGVNSTIRRAIDGADLVVIPVKPSPHDLRALGKTITLVQGMARPLVFVLNCASSRAKITSEAAIALSQHGTVAPVIIHQRADFASSMVDGQTVMEIARKSPSADEIAQLWAYLDDRLNNIHRVDLAPLQQQAAFG